MRGSSRPARRAVHIDIEVTLQGITAAGDVAQHRLRHDALPVGQGERLHRAGLVVEIGESDAVRIGRGELNRMISFMRVPNTWPVTSFAASDARNTAIGAFLSGAVVAVIAIAGYIVTQCYTAGMAGAAGLSRLQARSLGPGGRPAWPRT